MTTAYENTPAANGTNAAAPNAYVAAKRSAALNRMAHDSAIAEANAAVERAAKAGTNAARAKFAAKAHAAYVLANKFLAGANRYEADAAAALSDIG